MIDGGTLSIGIVIGGGFAAALLMIVDRRGGTQSGPSTPIPEWVPTADAPVSAVPIMRWKNDAPELMACDHCRRVYPVGVEHVCSKPFASA